MAGSSMQHTAGRKLPQSLQVEPIGALEAPSGAQKARWRLQVEPKSHPRPPKWRPRGAQERPRASQNTPRAAQEVPKSAQERQSLAQDVSKRLEVRPKKRPRCSKWSPRVPKLGPTCAQEAPIFCPRELRQLLVARLAGETRSERISDDFRNMRANAEP